MQAVEVYLCHVVHIHTNESQQETFYNHKAMGFSLGKGWGKGQDMASNR